MTFLCKKLDLRQKINADIRVLISGIQLEYLHNKKNSFFDKIDHYFNSFKFVMQLFSFNPVNLVV